MDDRSKSSMRIVVAKVMPPEKLQSIAEVFSQRLNIPKYELVVEEDKDLLGGFVVYALGKRYDFSLRGRLASINRKLQESSGSSEQGRFMEGQSLKEELQSKTQELSAEDEQDLSFAKLWETEGEELSDKEKQADLHLLMDDYLNSLSNALDISDVAVDEVGEVISVGDGIAYVSGLDHCKNEELIIFSANCFGIAMNLEETRVGVVLLGDIYEVNEGTICKRSGRTLSVPGGDALLGRVVDALGKPLDGAGPIRSDAYYPIERVAPNVVDRQPVNQPLYTGITAIDAMTPIGRGQRELIIGDRQTGKTSICLDTIINQKGKGVRCVYVSIGQKLSNLANYVQILRDRGAMEYTTVVVASASEQASMQYIAPYAGCAIAESWLYSSHSDVLIVYDDLSKHAQAYRALSLLLRRPPGREAFPGDVFFLHSRLLERACRLSDELGGGSISALPIVETQAGDISAYIPTNVISITDGQIYLETDLFYSGQRPAINVGLSVSRVGGAAQTAAMKKVAGNLRINLAQYKEIAAFSQFGSELDDETQAQIKKGSVLNEILKQGIRSSRSMAESVVLLYLANQAALVSVAPDELPAYSEKFTNYLHLSSQDVLTEIEQTGILSEEHKARLLKEAAQYIETWNAQNATSI